ncbi:Beta-glucosidase, lactase phlorizinhydrolase [Handroanthus impetiginosus]|uniref:Beta-glucosidase, lactase phlorizinhydrolase n=1 Tax=Handroanthus impetiginosus TaxID=429701 RepID=A0A2G9FXZ6_9LAMI|nr:Beta-glucosidase, lactase phlorizinhydrolase [Handroanthus impetiginosus]
MKNMKLKCTIFSRCLILLLLWAISEVKCSIQEQSDIKRTDFPNGFLFGAATSAYQIEGAFLEDGKGLSNWDAYCRITGSIADGRNGDVADDHYHRYMEDIEIMHSLGLTAYRLSISWSRILPRGRLGEVNQVAVMFYNKIIDNLLLRGIEPFVTIYHFEHPQEFEERFGGWLSPLMQDEYVHFAKTCFENFGDRVKYWITINEPNLFSELAYERASYPPARCSPPFGNCASGNSDVEPLISAHNMLLGHAKAAKLYREQFKSKVDGLLGITVSAFMYVPLTDSEDDKEAAERALAFNSAWTLDPVVFGDYPPEMKRYHGSELPTFSSEERDLLRDSIDFIGINHYGSLYAKDCIHSSCICNDSSCTPGGDRAIRGFVYQTGVRNGVFIGDPTGMVRFFVVPRGMEEMVHYIKERYHNKPMLVTENGYSSPPSEYDDYRHDVKRIRFHQSYLAYLAQAIRKGADVRGYFIWSLMDNFEWSSGFRTKFGIYHIDSLTLNRIPKLSARWYRDFLTNSSHFDADLLNTISYRNKVKSE